MKEIKFQKTVLDNGLTIITEKNDNFYTSCIGYWIKCGSIFEEPHFSGISHLLEHLIFKGTEKRNTKEISEFIESKGGMLNAFTGKEMTSVYARILPEHFESATDLISDIIFNSIIPEEELQKEKEVVYDEIRDTIDNPSEYIIDLFYKKFFANHPIGNDILGEISTLSQITRKDLLNYRNKFYTPDNTIISSVGPVNHDSIVKFIQKYIQNSSSQDINKIEIKKIDFEYKPIIHFENRNIAQVHSIIGLPGIEYSSEYKFAFKIFNFILGGGMSSILFQEIREQLGIAYNIFSALDMYSNIGLFSIYFSTETKKYNEALEKVFHILHNLKKFINEDLIIIGKNQLKAGLLTALEGNKYRMEKIAKDLFYYGDYYSIKDILNAIDSVTVDDIINIYEKFLQGNVPSIIGIGNVDSFINKIQLQKI